MCRTELHEKNQNDYNVDNIWHNAVFVDDFIEDIRWAIKAQFR